MGPVFEQVAQEYTPRALELLNLMGAKHPTEDHFYLYVLGTKPQFQGRGIGSALMQPVLEECDRRAIPAYSGGHERREQAALPCRAEQITLVLGAKHAADTTSTACPSVRAPSRKAASTEGSSFISAAEFSTTAA